MVSHHTELFIRFYYFTIFISDIGPIERIKMLTLTCVVLPKHNQSKYKNLKSFTHHPYTEVSLSCHNPSVDPLRCL